MNCHAACSSRSAQSTRGVLCGLLDPEVPTVMQASTIVATHAAFRYEAEAMMTSGPARVQSSGSAKPRVTKSVPWWPAIAARPAVSS